MGNSQQRVYLFAIFTASLMKNERRFKMLDLIWIICTLIVYGFELLVIIFTAAILYRAAMKINGSDRIFKLFR